MIVGYAHLVLDLFSNILAGMPTIRGEVIAVPNLYQTSRESKTLEIEDTDRDGQPFRILITLRKLGVVTALDYFLSNQEAEEIRKALARSGSHAG